MHKARQQKLKRNFHAFWWCWMVCESNRKNMTRIFESWHLPMDMRFSLFALRLGCSGKSAGVFLVFPCKGGICKWSSSQIWSWALKGLFCNQLTKILVVVKHYVVKKTKCIARFILSLSFLSCALCACFQFVPNPFWLTEEHCFQFYLTKFGAEPPSHQPWADLVSSCISVYLHPIGQWFIEAAGIRSYAETFWDLKPFPGISTDLSQELSNREQCYSMLQWQN